MERTSRPGGRGRIARQDLSLADTSVVAVADERLLNALPPAC